jgi:hypothetical protein
MKRTTAVAVVIGLLLASPAEGSARAPSAGPGCATARRAVAHYAGGLRLRRQPSAAPIPCGMPTGYAGGESAIAVTNRGAVFYAPAVQAFAGVQTQYFLGGSSGFARTTDLGRTWSFVKPDRPRHGGPPDPHPGHADQPVGREPRLSRLGPDR